MFTGRALGLSSADCTAEAMIVEGRIGFVLIDWLFREKPL